MSKKSLKDFAKEYDTLFEKTKLQRLTEKKIKILTLVAVITVGFAIGAPFLVFPMTALIVQQSEKKLTEIEAKQPFMEIPIFKEKLKITSLPDYKKVKDYQLKMENQTLDFGNGYEMQIKEANKIENHLSEVTVKPTEGYDSDQLLLMVNSSEEEYMTVPKGETFVYDYSDSFTVETYNLVTITGNLVESAQMQRNKEKGSFLELIPQEKIGDVQTGIVVNYAPSHGTSQNEQEMIQGYLMLTKYWLFPDGVGVLIYKEGTYLNTFAFDQEKKLATDAKLKEIDTYTQGAYTWLENHFSLNRSKIT